jgi:hypothetical protein
LLDLSKPQKVIKKYKRRFKLERAMECGCKAVFVNNKWIYEEYCDEHDPDNTISMAAFHKPLKKFRISQEYDI